MYNFDDRAFQKVFQCAHAQPWSLACPAGSALEQRRVPSALREGPTPHGAGGSGGREKQDRKSPRADGGPLLTASGPSQCGQSRRFCGFGFLQLFLMSGEMVVVSRPPSGCWKQGHQCRSQLQVDPLLHVEMGRSQQVWLSHMPGPLQAESVSSNQGRGR